MRRPGAGRRLDQYNIAGAIHLPEGRRPVSIKVIALDLERTLISDALSAEPRSAKVARFWGFLYTQSIDRSSVEQPTFPVPLLHRRQQQLPLLVLRCAPEVESCGWPLNRRG
jgi:hypothetical protein